MKKLLILFGALFLLLGNVQAQKGKQAIGFGMSYGTEIESLGVGVKYQYNLTNPLRIEPSFNYFFENDHVSMLDLNLNFHYLCPIANNVKVYPLVGLTFANWMFDGVSLDIDDNHITLDDDNETRFGMNFGAGLEFNLNRQWTMNMEFRYQMVDDVDQGIFHIGAAYRF